MEIIITILTDNADENLLLRKINVNYGSQWQGDSIVIYQNKIEISGNRTDTRNKYNNDRKIYTSTFYNHIIRSLVYLYASEMKPMKIITFEIKRKGTHTEEVLLRYSKESEINQLFSSIPYNHPSINIRSYFETFDVFNKRRRNDCFTDIVMYFLQGASSVTDEKDAFEYYWRSLNCLSAHHCAIGKTDKIQLEQLKEYLDNYSNKFSKSKQIIIDSDISFISDLGWNKYFDRKIQRDNAYKDISKRANNDDTDLVFVDKKFLEIFKKLFFTSSRNLAGNTNLRSLIDNKIAENLSNDTDFLTFLVTRYIYFVRCANFHADINYERFTLFSTNKYDNEFKRINSLLKIFIPELVDSLPSNFFVS